MICFDEITLHKEHGKYPLVISAPEFGLVLDVLEDRSLEDRSKERLLAWLEERGKAWCEGVEVACSDMWDAYQEAAVEKLPNARRVIDRFHVMKNLTDALTKARRIIQRDANAETKELLKGCRWLLVKNPENLKEEEERKLTRMLAASPELATCYRLKEDFRALFNQSIHPQRGGQNPVRAMGEPSRSHPIQGAPKVCRNPAQLVEPNLELLCRSGQQWLCGGR